MLKLQNKPEIQTPQAIGLWLFVSVHMQRQKAEAGGCLSDGAGKDAKNRPEWLDSIRLLPYT